MVQIVAPDGANISYSVLDLAGTYSLSSPIHKTNAKIDLPGDVHTALLANGEIPDPYFASNEKAVMWVNERAWAVERQFVATPDQINGYLTLTLSEIDCIAKVFLNGEAIASAQNAFIRYDIDVSGKVLEGKNTLRIEFGITRDVAKARAEAHPFPIPFTNNYKTNGLAGIHMNFVRKAACHAGWDWGICLMPIGVYGTMSLRKSRLARQDSVQVDQNHSKRAVELTIKTSVFAFASGDIELTHTIGGQTVADKVSVSMGENVFHHTVTIKDPDLWWPAGQGGQPLYELTTELDGEKTVRKLGLRKARMGR
ncbi:hypothetical protein PSQ19_00640 [Devosia algicola]|uniref:beta-mannosidase n=1 Tax=Devosia algicola TaxID=3026418 RepID=A0ABY7YN95_9HYPH|nr:hypothetical protein [Devosia algicola]WDR02781.1 hypothetical protein PSQ19_00640 [Devosia algicola]